MWVLPGTAGTVSFKYDPFGRRIQKSGPSGTTNYLYDGANIVEEVDPAGNALAKYTQGAGIDEPLAMIRGGATSYYETDGLGSVTLLTDPTASAVAVYTYDSFGKVTSPGGGVTNTLRYTGREFDAETGLYYYRARYYDAAVGRFLGEDPVRFRAGTNSYTYVKSNPLNKRDPSGLAPSSPNYQACFCMRTYPFPAGAVCQYECVCEPIGLPIVWIPVVELAKTCGLHISKWCGWQICPRFAIVERDVEGPYGLSPYRLLSCVQ